MRAALGKATAKDALGTQLPASTAVILGMAIGALLFVLGLVR